MGKMYHIRITLRDTKPPIWRTVAVPADITLAHLHDVIQIVMGWTDTHMHHFLLEDKSLKKNPDELARLLKAGKFDELLTASHGKRVFVPRTDPFGGELDLNGEDESKVTLAEVCPKVKTKLAYEYDFGDSWQHIIEVQKIVDPEPGAAYPMCLKGKRATPPEDCGGVPGYEYLMEILADPNHEEYEERVEWLGDEFDPEEFDLEEVNDILAEWREHMSKRRS